MHNMTTGYTAREIMSAEVLTVSENWSIKRLADFFLEHNITGSPVISSEDQFVGVVSVSDIFRFSNADEESKGKALKSCYMDATGIDIVNRSDLVEWSKNAHNNCTVHQIMANHIISVEAEDTLSDIATTMVNNDIHRVFVTKDKKIIGVISTSDILRILAKPVRGVKKQAVL